MMKVIHTPPTMRTWAKCPYCGAKLNMLYDDTANVTGLFTKCTRGCGREVKLTIKDGKQAL